MCSWRSFILLLCSHWHFANIYWLATEIWEICLLSIIYCYKCIDAIYTVTILNLETRKAMYSYILISLAAHSVSNWQGHFGLCPNIQILHHLLFQHGSHFTLLHSFEFEALTAAHCVRVFGTSNNFFLNSIAWGASIYIFFSEHVLTPLF